MENLTFDQVREGLDWMQRNYDTAMESGAYDLASMISRKIDAYQIELVGRIHAEDPYTTAADIRYFENFR
jgi:hypothetical protein